MGGPGLVLTKAERVEFFAENDKCVGCGRTERLTIDHIIPRSAGGGDDWSNLQTLCHYCNTQKGTKSDREWRSLWADALPGRPSALAVMEGLR